HIESRGIAIRLSIVTAQVALQILALDGGRTKLVCRLQQPDLITVEAIRHTAAERRPRAIDGVFGGTTNAQAAAQRAGIVGGVLNAALRETSTEMEHMAFGIDRRDHTADQ